MSLVVKAKIKEVVKDCNVSGDFADGLSEKLAMCVKDACQRADGNGRKTVMAKDIPWSFVADNNGSMLVVKSQLKEVASGYNVGGDLADALNNIAGCLVSKACERAESNGRKTVMAKDL